MSRLTRGDVAEAAVMGVVSGLRARDVPERYRNLFEVGRSGLAGVLGWNGTRSLPDLEATDAPRWLPAVVGVGGAALTFASRGVTQRTEDALDRGLARIGVRRPRLVVAGAAVALQLASRWQERVALERAEAAAEDGPQTFTEDMSE